MRWLPIVLILSAVPAKADISFFSFFEAAGEATAPLNKSFHIGGSGWWNKNAGQESEDVRYIVRTKSHVECRDRVCQTVITKVIEKIRVETKR